MFGRSGNFRLFDTFFSDPFLSDPLFNHPFPRHERFGGPSGVEDVFHDHPFVPHRHNRAPHAAGPTITEVEEEYLSATEEEGEEECRPPLVEEPDDTEEETAHNRRHWESTAASQRRVVPGQHQTSHASVHGYTYYSSSSFVSHGGFGGHMDSQSANIRSGPGGVVEVTHSTSNGRTRQQSTTSSRHIGRQGHTVHQSRMGAGPVTSNHTLHNLAADEWAAFDRDWAQLAGGSFLHHHQPGQAAHPQVLGSDCGHAHSFGGGLFQDVNVRGRRIHIE